MVKTPHFHCGGGGMGSNPGAGTKIPHALGCGQKKKAGTPQARCTLLSLCGRLFCGCGVRRRDFHRHINLTLEKCLLLLKAVLLHPLPTGSRPIAAPGTALPERLRPGREPLNRRLNDFLSPHASMGSMRSKLKCVAEWRSENVPCL